MPSTEIILTENIPGLGAEADVVKVRRGYARNFLLPQGKAYEVTKRSLRQLDNLKAKRAAREAAELGEAEELARRIGKLKVVFMLETGETGKAFGSVTAQDLVKFVQALREQRIPNGVPAGLGIAGGSGGMNAVVEGGLPGGYDLIVLANLDPPTAERVARMTREWLGVHNDDGGGAP